MPTTRTRARTATRAETEAALSAVCARLHEERTARRTEPDLIALLERQLDRLMDYWPTAPDEGTA